jgi:hypothetical protein
MQTSGSAHWWSLHEFNLLTTAAPSTQPPVPTLLTEAAASRAIALDSVLFTMAPFSAVNSQNFSPDQRTRVMLFAANLELLEGEDLSTLSANAIDSQNNVYPLSIEFVGKVPDYNWLSEVVLRLPENQSLTVMCLSASACTARAVTQPCWSSRRHELLFR